MLLGHRPPWFIVPSPKNLVSLPHAIPDDFDDEELARYAEELDGAVDEYFDLSDWDGIEDAAFAAALEDQEMHL